MTIESIELTLNESFWSLGCFPLALVVDSTCVKALYLEKSEYASSFTMNRQQQNVGFSGITMNIDLLPTMLLTLQKTALLPCDLKLTDAKINCSGILIGKYQ